MIKVEQLSSTFRRFVAIQKIKAGETLIDKLPLVSSVLSNLRKEHCNYCLVKKGQINPNGSVVDLSKCNACGLIYYCDKKCQTIDWKDHKKECKEFKAAMQKYPFKLTSEFHMLVRIFRNGINLDKFVSNYSQFSDDKVKFFTEQSVMVLKVLNEPISEENIQYLSNVQATIATNAITIQDQLFSTEGIAIGLFEDVHYLNHSCLPNAICIFTNSKIKVISIKDISEGEEICISYTDLRKRLNERRQFLQSNYHFNCECNRCKEEHEAGTSRIRCPVCKNGKVNDRTFTCNKCGSEKPVMNEKDIQNMYSIVQKAIKSSESANFTASCQLLEEAEQFVFSDFPQLSTLYNNIILAALNEAKYSEAYVWLKKTVTKHKYWYNEIVGNTIDLPFLGWKYNELSKLAFYLNKLKKAHESSEKALQILSKFYQPAQCNELQELHLRMRDIISAIQSGQFQQQMIKN